MSIRAHAAGDGGVPGPLAGTDGITSTCAARLSELVRAGVVTAEEVVVEHLDRIAEVDGQIGALVKVDRAGAVRAARDLSARLAAGEALGPLAGVPYVVKDNIDVRGQTTASGSHAHRGVVALRDSVVVDRLRRADAVLLGRANMDELAMGASTQTSAFGPTRNPRDLRRSPGGSSGGSAAAVAAGEATLSLGSDTGGSIREPASQCGVVGIAPSPGLVPMRGVVPFAPSLDRVGPLSRTVAGAALLLSVMADVPALAALPEGRDLHGLRVGLVEELVGPRNRPEVLARVAVVVDGLRRLGAEVVPVSIPLGQRALSVYMSVTSAASVSSLARYVETGLAGPEVVRRHELGVRLRDDGREELMDAARDQRSLRTQTFAALDVCDLLLSPTMPTTAPLLEGPVSPEEMADPMTAPYTDCWTVIANLVGLPAISFPSGLSSDDAMPVGAMLAGRPGSDGLLLHVAAALEHVSDMSE